MINSTIDLEEMLDQVIANPDADDQKKQVQSRENDNLDELLGNDTVDGTLDKQSLGTLPEREKLLSEIMDALGIEEGISEDSVISECEEFNSLALFNTVTLLQDEYKIRPHAKELMQIGTVGELIDYILNKIKVQQA